MNLSKDVMASIKDSLKDKWLDFCEANSYWLQEIKTINNNSQTPDQGKRPHALLILGVISSIAPETTNLIAVFLKLNGNADVIVRALELDFDPEIELKKRADKRAKEPLKEPSELDEIERIRQQLQKGEI